WSSDVCSSDLAGRPLPPTGIYRPPVRETPPPPPDPDEPLDADALPWGMRLRAWLAGIEWNGRVAAGVGAALVVAMLLGVWSARGCGGEKTAEKIENIEPIDNIAPSESSETIDLSAGGPAAAEEADDAAWEEPLPPPPATVEPPPAAVAELPASLKGWTLSGAKIAEESGGLTITFEVPIFESGAYLSKEGAPVLKALAAKLKGVPDGTRVRVTGFTDNVPLSKPTKDFASNADIAAARAAAAVEHLSAGAHNSGIVWDSAAGAEADAPWPNDTKEHRRLNRTAVVRVEAP
ncbi:MAG: hypothetical protein IK066_05255, partial [Kiritimatiellae bacterium]|nr:hypothetical protein [Kiritimatiellia bacterium]